MVCVVCLNVFGHELKIMKYLGLFLALILLFEIPALGSAQPQILSGKEIVYLF